MAHANLYMFFLLFFLVFTLSSCDMIIEDIDETDAQPISTTTTLNVVQTMNQLVKGDNTATPLGLYNKEIYLLPPKDATSWLSDDMPKKSRKLLEDGLMQPDYDYAGANHRHDPRRGRGGGGRSP